MSRKRKRKQSQVEAPEGDDGANEISTVYGDLVTFMMMLFVLMFVLSYNEKQESNFVTQLQIRFGEKC